jgi:low affinity Fe/Cu permease
MTELAPPMDTPADLIQRRDPLFQRITDAISFGQGTPGNIIGWAAAVITWTVLFAVGGPHIDSGTWLPAWFTSLGYNFPLNLVTTVAELFIGFLVAAATNRAEKALEKIIDGIAQTIQKTSRIIIHISDVEERLAASLTLQQQMLTTNTELTQQVHDLTAQVHALISGKTA